MFPSVSANAGRPARANKYSRTCNRTSGSPAEAAPEKSAPGPPGWPNCAKSRTIASDRIDAGGPREVTFPSDSDGARIAGYLYAPDDWKPGDASRPGILILAGYSGNTQADCTHMMKRLGIYGTSFGGANGIWVTAHDERVKCLVTTVCDGRSLFNSDF